MRVLQKHLEKIAVLLKLMKILLFLSSVLVLILTQSTGNNSRCCIKIVSSNDEKDVREIKEGEGRRDVIVNSNGRRARYCNGEKSLINRGEENNNETHRISICRDNAVKLNVSLVDWTEL